MLLKQAEGAVPGDELGEEEDDHVAEENRQGEAQRGEPAKPTEQEIGGRLAPVGPAHGPAGHHSRGQPEDDEEERGQPGDLGRGEFYF